MSNEILEQICKDFILQQMKKDKEAKEKEDMEEKNQK